MVIKLIEQLIINEEIVNNFSKLIRESGSSDIWYSLPVYDLLPSSMKSQSDKLLKGYETFEMWFSNSLSWSYVLEDSS
jgi:isoleucyl-tRNA synthetase